MQSIKRQTAYVCTAQQLLEGEYVQKEGWEPNYIDVNNKAVSRARVIGVIVSKESPMNYVIDDGTARMPVRFFNPDTKELPVGVPVMIIGRPREYNSERYLAAEIGKAISSDWASFYTQHRSEYQAFIPPTPKEEIVEKAELQAEVEPSVESTNLGEDMPKVANQAQQLIDAIKELDPGDGAPTDEVLRKVGFEGAEAKLTMLINEGEVFELRAGKIKVLE